MPEKNIGPRMHVAPEQHLTSKAICILGMHRSGTSVVARAVNLLGAYLGEDADLMAPAPDNPEGFWERNDIVQLHDSILDSFSLSWDTTVPLPNGWETSTQLRPFEEKVRELITVTMSGRQVWAWKDPRTCLLMPLWKRHLSEAGTSLATIFVSRNPRDVAHSLAKRNGFTLGRAYGIWFNYTLTALLALTETPAIFLSYDMLIDSGETELRKCAAELNLPWPEEASEAAAELHSLLKPSLRHSVSRVQDLDLAPRPVQALYRLICELVEQGYVPRIPEELLAPLARSFHEYAYFFQCERQHLAAQVRDACAPVKNEVEAVKQKLEERTKWNLQLDKELIEKKEQLAKLRAEFDERTAWALQLREESNSRGELLAKLQAEFQERSNWAVRLQDEAKKHAEQVAQLQQQLDERTAWALELQEETGKRAERIAQLQQQLDERTAWALELKKETEKRGELLAKLQADFEERSSWAINLRGEAETRGEQISSLQKDLAERTEWALQLKTDLGNCNGHIDVLVKKVESLESLTEASARELAVKNEALMDLKRDMQEMADEFAQREHSLKTEYATALAEKKQLAIEVESKTQRIDELVSSLSWKLTTPLRAVRGLFIGKK